MNNYKWEMIEYRTKQLLEEFDHVLSLSERQENRQFEADALRLHAYAKEKIAQENKGG